MLAIGLIYPAVLTIKQSFQNADSSAFVGLENYATLFRESGVPAGPGQHGHLGPARAHRRDADRADLRRPGRPDPDRGILQGPRVHPHGDLHGRCLDHLEVRVRLPAHAGDQIGLANQIIKSLGLDTYQFLLTEPWNTFFLIVVMIWIQAGFAMTVLSASIKAIPDDIIEAAKLDGVSGPQMFRFITLPSIRPGMIVVLTTIAIGTLKVFDIVRTMTGGRFKTSVVANEFYTQAFRYDNAGLGRCAGRAALHPRDPDHRLQHLPAPEGGPLMTALNPAAHTIPEGEELVPNAKAKAPKATEASIALRQKSIWASLIAALIAILWTIPTVGLLITSFRPAADIRKSGWWTVWQDPSFTLDNYQKALFGGTTNLASYFVNSLVITIPAVVIPISIACMAAYGFAWMNFQGAKFLFVAVFALQIVPIQVTLIPLLTLFVDAGLAGTFWPIWIAHSIFALPLAIYLHAQLHERAAQGARRGRAVDGAGT